MSDVQYSEDGQWWWDTDATPPEWKPVAAGASSSAGSGSSSPDPSASPEQSASPTSSASPEQSASPDPAASPEQAGAGVNTAVTADNADDYFAQAMDAGEAEATEV
jgi:hypothetical protein